MYQDQASERRRCKSCGEMFAMRPGDHFQRATCGRTDCIVAQVEALRSTLGPNGGRKGVAPSKAALAALARVIATEWGRRERMKRDRTKQTPARLHQVRTADLAANLREARAAG